MQERNERSERARSSSVIGLLGYAGVSVEMAQQLTLGNHLALKAQGSIVETPYEDVAFPSRVDQIILRGWLFKAPSPSGRSVIIVHGFHQNRVNADFNAAGLSKDLLAHGYDVLLFDLRSCGTSGGDRFTLGTLEPRDLLGAYDFMRGRGYAPARMAIVGDSEGAVTVLGAAKDLAPVAALVADSAFAELKPILEAQLPHNTTLPPIFYPGGELVSELFGLNPNLRPVDAVRALPARAFLFFHGGADRFIPVSNAARLAQASTNRESKLAIVPGAGHVKSYRTNPRFYLATLYAFIDQQVAEHGA
jgi:alpha-beta hydrolase superfamily lysophospholipase